MVQPFKGRPDFLNLTRFEGGEQAACSGMCCAINAKTTVHLHIHVMFGSVVGLG